MATDHNLISGVHAMEYFGGRCQAPGGTVCRGALVKGSGGVRWVKTEASDGLDRGTLVSALVEQARIPLEFKRVQAANLFDWGGKISHPELEKLLRSIETLVRRFLSENTNYLPYQPNLRSLRT